ncbi:hypothetical protein AB0K00_27135 [Dactylosporangium sp. NPDC049525]|uniref:hypothetical protein n=1 Tax=Dactylosporangium sp. NPDC049525 TaxID=3154730 RepID=UPI003415E15B
MRVEQSCRRIDRLRETIADWVARRQAADALQQYQTQLATLGAVLGGCLADLRAVVDAVPGGQPAPGVFGLCRDNDQRVELVRKLFEHYRTRFDQRDTPAAGDVLRAADEIVWSCWAEPFRNAGRDRPDLPIAAAPLPYLEPGYAAAAIPRLAPSSDLETPADDDVLQRSLALLPLPLLALPALCLDDPWWLVCVGHEVGHHLEYDLTGDLTVLAAFAEEVEAASLRAGAARPDRWRSWSREIFADVCSVLSMGPAAVHAVAQLELDDEQRMLDSQRAHHPPPLVRTGLLIEVARQLGVDAGAAAGPVDPGRVPAVTAEVDVARAVAAAALAAPLGGHGPLSRYYDWEPAVYADRGLLWNMSEGLLGKAPLAVRPRLRSARLLTAAAATAWRQVASIADPGRREALRRDLAGRYLAEVPRSREEGTRSARMAGASAPAVVQTELTDLLLRAGSGATVDRQVAA